MYSEEEFQQSGGGWWIQVIGVVVYMMVIVAYAVQTLLLVTWLFPDDNWFMRLVTVFVCDGCATLYALAEMLYRFKLRRSKNLVMGMWVTTFVLSTAATVIQMYLSSTHNIPHSIDPFVIEIAYGLIIFAFVVNIVSITTVIRWEYNAGLPVRRYLDDPGVGKKLIAQLPQKQIAAAPAAKQPAPAKQKIAANQPPPPVVEPVDADQTDPNTEDIEEILADIRAEEEGVPDTSPLP